MAKIRMEVGVGPGITVGQLEEQLGKLRVMGLRDSVLGFKVSGPPGSFQDGMTMLASRDIPQGEVVDSE